MSVLNIEQYRQRDGSDILKVILKPNKQFPNGSYFYCDNYDKELVRNFSWHLLSQKTPYVVTTAYDNHKLRFHREKAHNILSYYPDCINHINMVRFDNINKNLDIVSQQQNQWYKPSKGYVKDRRYKIFQPNIKINYQIVRASCVKTEVEACLSAYQLELQYENYRYDFLRDRRNDLDILDLERRGRISEEEAVYRHICRYALDNAWYVYRYNLFEYFRDNHLKIPNYAIDSNGFMVHSITGQRLCPL